MASSSTELAGCGTGFSVEHPVSRILCDARVLSIFEGAAEIQAQVIAKRMIEGGN
jgi:(2S)-methylsuccinyl-CoA dehydrogenase